MRHRWRRAPDGYYSGSLTLDDVEEATDEPASVDIGELLQERDRRQKREAHSSPSAPTGEDQIGDPPSPKGVGVASPDAITGPTAVPGSGGVGGSAPDLDDPEPESLASHTLHHAILEPDTLGPPGMGEDAADDATARVERANAQWQALRRREFPKPFSEAIDHVNDLREASRAALTGRGMEQAPTRLHVGRGLADLALSNRSRLAAARALADRAWEDARGLCMLHDLKFREFTSALWLDGWTRERRTITVHDQANVMQWLRDAEATARAQCYALDGLTKVLLQQLGGQSVDDLREHVVLAQDWQNKVTWGLTQGLLGAFMRKLRSDVSPTELLLRAEHNLCAVERVLCREYDGVTFWTKDGVLKPLQEALDLPAVAAAVESRLSVVVGS